MSADVSPPVLLASLRGWETHLGRPLDEAAAERLRRSLGEGTLPRAFAAGAHARPGARVRVGVATITAAELQDLVGRVARLLAERHGFGRGDRVLVLSPSSLELVVGYLALLHLGCTVTMANPAYRREELLRLVRVAESRAVLAAAELADSRLEGLAVDVVPLDPLIGQASQLERLEPAELDSGDIAQIAFTSGTTSEPKGVPLTHAQLLSSVRGIVAAWHWRSEDVLVHALPLFHQHGLSGLHAALLSGSDLVVLPRFDPEELVAEVERVAGTILFGVPSIYRRLLDAGLSDARARLSSLRLATCGSAPLSPALARDFRDQLGLRLLERYGSTESGLNVSNVYGDSPVAGSVGLPLPGVEIAVARDGVVDLSGSGSGEVLLRGPQVFDGYLNASETTADAFLPGGWFRTGDLGSIDEDGRLTITGRLKELIITGGMNVSPGEVEDVIAAYGGVADVAVSGIPDARWGEAVCAWVVPEAAAQIDPTSLMAHCRAHVADFKVPKRIFFVEDLPRNDMGKIQRSRLEVPA
ncbi:class I adenylate-forming enzyme family protein [Aeromicrobium phragmitis]|nr:AMP-binding protein [Aeromicrobium phragmitis]